ncbi:MAG: Phytochrome-like protein cph2 [Ramlibacter sp.]|jgi:signal transduction histidine kinase|nr:Phytochrome-like protein cph2 [Ramlibacter sp.]
MRFIFLLLCALLLLSGRAVAADKVLDVAQLGRNAVSLTEYFTVLEDPGLALTLADMQRPEIASRFAGGQAPAPALSYGFKRSAYWLRLTLRNASGQPALRMMEVGYPILSDIQFHRPMADGTYESLVTGVATPFSTRPYPSRSFVFPVALPAHSQQVVYLRVQSVSAMLVPALLWEPQSFHAHERDDYATQAWYFGMASALILFNLLLFVALRDVVYLLYSVFATCTALAISASNGWGKEFIWPETTLWSNIAISVFGSLTLAALLLFTRRMLNTREVIPRVDRLIKVFVVLQLLFAVGVAISPQGFAVPGTVLISVTAVLILSVGVFCAVWRRQRIAVFFVAAFSVWILGTTVVGLKTLTLLPANTLTMNGYQIGSALEMLLLAFALAYRFNMIRRQATEDVRQANEGLAQRLQAREAELTASHQRLREIEHRQTLSQERQRLMQDMHDGMGSSLNSALRVVERGQLNEAEVAQVLKGCIDDLKLAIDSMEPVESDVLLLLATLRFRLEPRLESTGIALRWEVQNIPPLDWLDPRNSLHILRIVQEAFTNIIKHANATEVRVATAADADAVTVSISDNGSGFDVERALKSGGKGLANQLRRAQAIGAEITWASSGCGTRLTLRLPFVRQVGLPETKEYDSGVQA